MCFAHFNSPAPQSWGEGFSISLLSLIMITWISYRLSLLIIMKKSFIPAILVLSRLKISTRWLIAVIPLLVELCMPALTAGFLNLSLFAAIPGFALPAAISTPANVQLLWSANSSAVIIVTVFLQSLKNSDTSFWKIVSYWIASSLQSGLSSPACSSISINQRILSRVSSVSSIHLADPSNGTLTSIMESGQLC